MGEPIDQWQEKEKQEGRCPRCHTPNPQIADLRERVKCLGNRLESARDEAATLEQRAEAAEAEVIERVNSWSELYATAVERAEAAEEWKSKAIDEFRAVYGKIESLEAVLEYFT